MIVFGIKMLFMYFSCDPNKCSRR